jgi:hypothetical protein
MIHCTWASIPGHQVKYPTQASPKSRCRIYSSRPILGVLRHFETALLYPRCNPWDIISGGLLPSHAFASPRSILPYLHAITNSNFILRECVHQLQRPRRCRSCDRVSRGGCRGNGWRARIKGGGCGLFRIDELGAIAKVTLVLDSSIWIILEVARCDLIGHPPWHLTRDVTDPVGGIVGTKWACDGYYRRELLLGLNECSHSVWLPWHYDKPCILGRPLWNLFKTRIKCDNKFLYLGEKWSYSIPEATIALTAPVTGWRTNV